VGSAGRIALAVGAIQVSLSACGFEINNLVPDDGARPDVPDGQIDVPPDQPPRMHSVAASVYRPSGTVLVTLPFDEQNGFSSPCPDSPGPASRFLLAHPHLPYVYGVVNSFDGMTLECTTSTRTTLGMLGATRPVQRISFNPTSSIGFFTLDGAGPIGVFRFTVTPDGVPALSTSANAPTASGALAVDWTTKQLYTAGQSVVWNYALTAATDFPASATMVSGCGSPIDLVTSGTDLFLFCADSGIVRRFTTSPFAVTTDAGTLGAVDAVRAISSSRAIAARMAPPDLAFVDLGSTITVTPAATLPGRVTALSTSDDGTILVSATQTQPSTSDVTVWRVLGTSLQVLDTTSVPGTITSLAVALPP
jgi:hypothetical protein